MALDGAWRDGQRTGDLAIGEPVGEKAQDLLLARAQQPAHLVGNPAAAAPLKVLDDLGRVLRATSPGRRAGAREPRAAAPRRSDPS